MPSPPFQRRAKPLLGTLVEIGIELTSGSPASEAEAFEASDRAFAAVAGVHQRMSRHEPDSELTAINTAEPGRWVAISPDTVAVLAFACALSQKSAGVFDVFSFRQAPERPHPPPWQTIELDAVGRRIRQRAGCPAVRADLGGIAKGYAVDCAVQALRDAGVAQGWVNAGGDVRVFGDLALPLLVRSPTDPSQCIDCTVLKNRAAATSAHPLSSDRDRPGALYHGTTRRPAPPGYSWTVAAPDCMTSDALTKLIAATGNTHHPLLTTYSAQSWIYPA